MRQKRRNVKCPNVTSGLTGLNGPNVQCPVAEAEFERENEFVAMAMNALVRQMKLGLVEKESARNGPSKAQKYV